MSEHDTESENIEETYTRPLQLQEYEIIYDENIIVRTSEKDQTYNFKIAQRKIDDNSSEVRVEMTLENDIYSVRQFIMDSDAYKEWIRHQKYKKCKFENFAEHLRTILENSRTNRSAYNVKFLENDDFYMLELQQRLEFKTVDIFNLEFHDMDPNDQYVHDQAQYRYHLKISDYNDKKNELRQLLDFVNKKNPTLGTQLRRGLKIDL